MAPAPDRVAVALNGYGIEDEGRREILPSGGMAGLARTAEDLGFESIFTPEIAGREAFGTLTGFADVTERVGLVTGVVPFASRDPVTMAMAASSLAELSGDRFTLGLGSRESIAATRGRLLALRAVLEGSVGPGAGTDWPSSSVPLYLAALGPRMVGLAGEVADGVILNWCTPDRVAEARRAIGPREGFTIAVYVRACLSHVGEHATVALRVAAARYGQLEPYARQFRAMGIDPDDPAAIADAVCVRGDPDGALARLAEYVEAGADVVVVYPVPAGEAVSSITGTMMAAAPNPEVAP